MTGHKWHGWLAWLANHDHHTLRAPRSSTPPPPQWQARISRNGGGGEGGVGVGGRGGEAGGAGGEGGEGAHYTEEFPLSKALQRTLAYVKPTHQPRTPSRDQDRSTLNNLNSPQIHLTQAPSPIVPFFFG